MSHKQKRIKHTGALFVQQIPQDLKYHFKAWAAKRGKTLRAAIIEIMEEKTGYDGEQ